MANEAGCCEGEGRSAAVAVLVLSIIIFMANIYAMIMAQSIHAYYWIMTYHFVGTIGVLVATSVFACRLLPQNAAAPASRPSKPVMLGPAAKSESEDITSRKVSVGSSRATTEPERTEK